MKKPAPAQQLPLCLSIEASADLTQALAVAQGHIDALQAELLAHAQVLAKVEARYAKCKKTSAYWERRAKQAEAERNAVYKAKLEDADHPLHSECQRLTKEVADLRATLRQWVERSLKTHSGSLDRDVLTKLLVLAHPDRWSQGQTAAELAHELSVAINQMREGARA